jgi:hypothetical protein
MKKKNSNSRPPARNKAKPMPKRATKSPAFAKRAPKPKIPALGSGMIGGLGGTGAQGMMP